MIWWNRLTGISTESQAHDTLKVFVIVIIIFLTIVAWLDRSLWPGCAGWAEKRFNILSTYILGRIYCIIQYVHTYRCVCMYRSVGGWVGDCVCYRLGLFRRQSCNKVLFEKTQISQHRPLRLKGLTKHRALLCSIQPANTHTHTHIYTCVCACVPVFSWSIKWTLTSNEEQFSHLLLRLELSWCLLSDIWSVLSTPCSLGSHLVEG